MTKKHAKPAIPGVRAPERGLGRSITDRKLPKGVKGPGGESLFRRFPPLGTGYVIWGLIERIGEFLSFWKGALENQEMCCGYVSQASWLCGYILRQRGHGLNGIGFVLLALDMNTKIR